MAERISDELVTILQEARIDGNLLFLSSQLNPSVYLRVKDLLARCGGHWNRRKEAHEFQADAQAIVSALIESRKWPEKNPYAFFPSPKVVVDEVMLRIQDESICESPRILEPSAGIGAFAHALRNKFPKSDISLCELNEINVSCLKKDGFDVHSGDFLQYSPKEKFDLIVMNPPFSYDGHPNAWAEHIIHAFSMLKEYGILYAITPDLFGKKIIKELDQILSRHIYGFYSFPKDTFKSSGTTVGTSLISLYKKAMDYDDMDMYLRNERVLYDMVMKPEAIDYEALMEKVRQIYMEQNTYLRFSFEYLKKVADNIKTEI